jgi:hypothetical protein
MHDGADGIWGILNFINLLRQTPELSVFTLFFLRTASVFFHPISYSIFIDRIQRDLALGVSNSTSDVEPLDRVHGQLFHLKLTDIASGVGIGFPGGGR